MSWIIGCEGSHPPSFSMTFTQEKTNWLNARHPCSKTTAQEQKFNLKVYFMAVVCSREPEAIGFLLADGRMQKQ